MRLTLLAILAGVTSAGAAHAADQPVIGPVPSWVKPLPVPADDGKGADAPVKFLLSDQQMHVEPGKQTVYSDVAFKIGTPQGLAAGNISLPWNPATQVLTVHKVVIHRGDQSIDVLGHQSFTVIRRETNLDMAMLDGVMTANIQPEGLQVGDVLEFAVSFASSDPVLKDHVEQAAATWNGVPFARTHFRAEWPSEHPMRVQVTNLPPLKPVKTGATTTVELSMNDVQPVRPPKGAPPRYAIGHVAELTDFSSWSDVVALMKPLFDKASVIPADGAVQKELARIKAGSPDSKARAEQALALVQDKIRYVALAMGVGGLVPTDVETTWSRRFGDCKAKTALLLGLLHSLGIEAEPVLVSAGAGDGLDARLPMIGLFDHVLVRATVAGRTYWLDGTRSGDTSLDRLHTPAFRWGLPLTVGTASLVPMMPPPLTEPTESTVIRLDATAGVTKPASVHIETVVRGDAAIVMNASLATLGDARERTMRDYWRGEYEFIEAKSVSSQFDAAQGELRLILDGVAHMDWTKGYYETDDTAVGYDAAFTRDPGPNQDAPFAVTYPYYSATKEIILLPAGFEQLKNDPAVNVDEVVAGIEYHRRASLDGTTFTIEKTERSLVPEFPFKEAAAAQARLRVLAKNAATVPVPRSYAGTKADLDTIIEKTPANEREFLQHGAALGSQGKFAEAAADFTKALALTPKNGEALASRALAQLSEENFAGAAADLDALAAVDPGNRVLFAGRAMIEQHAGAHREAIEGFTKALAMEPNDAFVLNRRARSYFAIGDAEHALADAEAVSRLLPKEVEPYLLRANIHVRQGQNAEAAAVAALLETTNPGDDYAHVAAGKIYASLGRQAEALKAFDRALAIKPAAYIYLNRSEVRPKKDYANRRADLDEALKLQPGYPEALSDLGHLQFETGDIAGAVQTYSKALDGNATSAGSYAMRGVAYAKLGMKALAEKDFESARATAQSEVELNNICWNKATTGVALESALVDCDAALARAPDNAGFLDSRGLVLLKLGRLDEAIATYTKAVAKQPNYPTSLFGRAVAEARKGDTASSDADLAKATKLNPDIRDRFRDYGITL